MAKHMPDSQLNGAERALQQSFMKQPVFNGLLMLTAVAAAYMPIRAMPDRRPLTEAELPLAYQPVALPPGEGPFKLAGAWQLEAGDRRFGGLSALAIDEGRFLSISDRGAVVQFDRPGGLAVLEIADLRDGPGSFGKKWARDAESLARDPAGRGWWVGYEQNHSLWLYDPGFRRAQQSIELTGADWRDNRGAEGLVVQDGELLVLGENGADAFHVGPSAIELLSLHAITEIADAARAPDGSAWVLTRTKGLGGIQQSIAPLLKTHDGLSLGSGSPVPKGPFDNFEGMAIEAKPDGGWRFWLITDDGHRIMARTLLIALDLELPVVRHDEGPAQGTGPLQKPTVETP